VECNRRVPQHSQCNLSRGFPEIDVPFWQSPWPDAISLRTSGDPPHDKTIQPRFIGRPTVALRIKTMDQIVDMLTEDGLTQPSMAVSRLLRFCCGCRNLR